MLQTFGCGKDTAALQALPPPPDLVATLPPPGIHDFCITVAVATKHSQYIALFTILYAIPCQHIDI